MKPLSSMDEQFIKKLTQVIDENLQDEDFGASKLAAQLGMSRVTLYRRVKSIIKKSVAEFIRETRLKRAYEMLRKKTGTVSEIAYNVGFSHPQYFNKCFQDYYGVTPGDVLKGVRPVSEVEDGESLHRKPKLPKVSSFYFGIIAVLVVVSGLFIYFNFFKPIPADKNDFIVLVIPPFNDENPDIANDKAKLIRHLLHDRLNLSKLHVKDQSITDDSTYVNTTHQQLVELLNADYILRCDRAQSKEEAIYFFRLLDKQGNKVWSADFVENESSAWDFAGDIVSFIVSELDIQLTPEEKEQIKKLPSENVFALKMYEDGMKLLELSNANLEDMKRAISSFEAAIQHDPTFADAYARLTLLYSFLLPKEEQDIPKAKQYILKALQYEKKYAWYYYLLAGCFEAEGNIKASDSCRNIANQFPRHDKYYYGSKAYQSNVNAQHYEAIRYGLMYFRMNEGSGDPPPQHSLHAMWTNLSLMGFPEVAKKYLIKLMAHWGNDTTQTGFYRFWLSEIYGSAGELEKAKEYALYVLNNDTSWFLRNHWNVLALADGLLTYEMVLGNIEESYYYIELTDSIRKANNIEFNPRHGDLSYGFACMEAGKKEKAMFVINKEIERCLLEIEQNSEFAKKFGSHMNLAAIYAYLDEKEKTLKYLNEVKESGRYVGYHRLLLDIPVFERISQKDREIRKVINDIKKQYERERSKIERLLKDEGLLVS